MPTPTPTDDAPLIAVIEASRAATHLGPASAEDHLRHSEAFLQAADWTPGHRWCDLGAGGGVPGLIAAWRHRDTQGTLLDIRSRRIEFLHWAVGELGVAQHTDVIEARAEEYAAEQTVAERFHIVLARAFGSPATTAECAAPLMTSKGVLIVSDPPSGSDRWPAEIPELGLTHEALVIDGFHFSRLTRTGPVEPRFPRRPGPMAKQPLF